MKKIFRTKTFKYSDSNMSWEQRETVVKPTEIWITGFVIEETDKYITLAAEVVTFDGYYEYRNQISVPKSCILKSN